MTESAPATQQHQADVAARVEELTSLYEQKAYLIYNVALRVTLDSASAQNAARRGFVAQAAAGAPEGLAPNIARLAVDEAGAAKGTPSDDPVLSATAGLSASERAALALTVLADTGPDAIATALGIDAAAAEQLRTRAFENLAAALELSADDAAASYRSLPWAEPPAELWQALYPELHAVASQTVRAAAQARAAAAARPGRLRRIARSLRVWRRIPRWAAVALIVLTAGGVAMAARGTGGGEEPAPEAESAYYGSYSEGDDGTSGGATGGGASSGGGSSYDALTPKELDKLRQQELEDLKRYSKRQADRELTPRQRRNAEKAAEDLVKLARRRERQAEKREQAARRQLAREREERIRERQQAARNQPPPSRPQQQPPPPPRSQPKDQQDPGSDGGGNEKDAPEQTDQAECLYDTESGTYVCPE